MMIKVKTVNNLGGQRLRVTRSIKSGAQNSYWIALHSIPRQYQTGIYGEFDGNTHFYESGNE